MARSARYKLIVGSGRRIRKDGYALDAPPPGPYERLYDEQDDPCETRDLAADPRLAGVKQELLDSLSRRLIATWNQASGEPVRSAMVTSCCSVPPAALRRGPWRASTARVCWRARSN